MNKGLLPEPLDNNRRWYRIADPSWSNPTDPTHAAERGGRWNPPNSWPTLYLNEDIVTARLNMALFTAAFPYEPEDLRDDGGPVLVTVTLPRNQTVADAHTPAGVKRAGLPATYPVDAAGDLVDHATCQPVGIRARALGLRGVRCRSATSPTGEGRELAWFPATTRSHPTIAGITPFADWYWA